MEVFEICITNKLELKGFDDMNNQITVLNSQEVLGQQFTVYGDIDNPLFLAKDVAQMIDNKNVSQMLNVVDDDEKVIYNVYTLGGNQDAWFLTEYGLYEVLMQSRKPIAKQFKKEIKAILKQLRQTGVVITESATQDAINYESKYGSRRIRKTFRDSTDIESTWNEFKELSQIERTAKRLTGQESINRCNQIIDELNKVKSENMTEWPYYKHALYDAMIVNAMQERQRLSNKTNGGIKSGQTKQLNKLESEKEELQERINTLEQYLNDDDEYYFIDRHPFTVNCMYAHDVKTPSYHRWINNLHLEEFLPKKYPGLDIEKPMAIKLLYGHKEFGSNGKPFDLVNFNKSIIDQIANFYGFNDSLIKKHLEETHKYVNSYEDGYIYVSLRNLTENEIDFLYNNNDDEE